MVSKLGTKVSKLSIVYLFLRLYNYVNEEKLFYYNTLKSFCQERNFTMDPEPSALKELITLALEECNDPKLLTLIYGLLIYEE